MSLSVLTGRGPAELTGLADRVPAFRPEHLTVLGAREIDPKEREAVRDRHGNSRHHHVEVDARGVSACIDEAIQRRSEGTAGFHLSFDLDVIDPTTAPGVGTAVPGGITYCEGHLICKKAAHSGSRSCDVHLRAKETPPVSTAT